jgi:hypothetical protein
LSVFGKFFKPEPTPTPNPPGEQAVLVYLKGEDFDLMIDLSEQLIDSLENSDVGMFDGNEIGGGEAVLFMYGPDAELLFKHVEPVFRKNEFCRGAKAVIQWGNPDAPKREVIL